MVNRFEPKPFLIMGVINVTPDSFSDGGNWATPDAARTAALQLLEDGADIIDFGAESTRPGATEISLQVELDRLMPVLDRVRQEIPGFKISVDSRRDEVFVQSADTGVKWFNRVGKIPSQGVLKRLAAIDQARVAMTHMHGVPESMQNAPLGREDALDAVNDFFETVDDQMGLAGFDRKRVWCDPGIGFGKDMAGNLVLLGEIRKWNETRQVMVGVSRKSFIGRLFDIASPVDRDGPGKAIESMCALAGAGVIRTHDVKGLSIIRQRMAGGH